MSSVLYRLGHTLATARLRVIAAWLMVLVTCALLAVGLGGRLNNEFSIPGTQSQQGIDLLSQRFPVLAGSSGQFVFTTTDGSPIADHAASITQTMQRVSQVNGVAAAPNPFDADNPASISQDGTTVIGTVQLHEDLATVSPATVDAVRDVATTAHISHVNIMVGGEIFTTISIGASLSEVVGLLLALIVLALTFRSLIAAGMPIVTAVLGAGLSIAGIYISAAFIDISSTTPTLAIMLGLAVGIDYALFLLSRHRHQLAEGMEVKESIARAVGTAGSAVIFAGLTVVIALVGLFVCGIPFLTVMGLASAGAVALAVLVAITLLPAILSLFGERLRPRRRVRKTDQTVRPDQLPSHQDSATSSAAQQLEDASTPSCKTKHQAAEASADDPTRSAKTSLPIPKTSVHNIKTPLRTRWARLITKHPIITIVGVLLVVGAVAVPAKDLALGLPDNGTKPSSTQARQTYDLIADKFGPGYNAPLIVTADIINTKDPLGVMAGLKRDIETVPGVSSVGLSTPNQGADLGIVQIVPDYGQNDPRTSELVKNLRQRVPALEARYDISDMKVTGQTAVAVDITHKLENALLPFGIFVVGLSLILLTMVFRSLWVPMKAAIGYLFSVGAAFGAVAMVFQYGWGNAALNIHMVAPVISFMPIVLMGVLFGLAMDYEVFLVSRIREDYVHTGKAKESIVSGFTASGSVVVAAALIMFAVFITFVPESSFEIQPIAFGLAVGVAVDAFLVRMTLVPAVLALLGDRAWRLPSWIDRRLPHLDVEGEGLVRVLEHRDWVAEHGDVSIRLENVDTPDLGVRGAPLRGLNALVSPGQILVVCSQDPTAPQIVMSLLSGRIAPTAGICVVHHRFVPDESSAVQARTHVIAAAHDLDADNIQSRLHALDRSTASGRTIVIEQISDLFPPSAKDKNEPPVASLERLLRRGATAVIGCSGPYTAVGPQADATAHDGAIDATQTRVIDGVQAGPQENSSQLITQLRAQLEDPNRIVQLIVDQAAPSESKHTTGYAAASNSPEIPRSSGAAAVSGASSSQDRSGHRLEGAES
ncbi:MMPL family transporter [Devriesea agamarum]|uniref:MMPL family transporter n=1 Tax=Devriesea agamarum TaxID=472569 RepID=UPI00071E5AF3|nr:MMPL family transporter [Devriesea agamarum]